mgnify:CR=1 FL=1
MSKNTPFALQVQKEYVPVVEYVLRLVLIMP